MFFNIYRWKPKTIFNSSYWIQIKQIKQNTQQYFKPCKTRKISIFHLKKTFYFGISANLFRLQKN